MRKSDSFVSRRSPRINTPCGIGFASHPESGRDLVMVVSNDGHGLFDAVTGEKIARDRDPDPEDGTPDAVADLTCPGLGPIAGSRVHIAGLFGGGLHTTTDDGWTLESVAPDWRHHRVLLSADGGLPDSGQTIAVATSSDVSLDPPPRTQPRQRRSALTADRPCHAVLGVSGRPRG